ncbi:MAG TPA: MFS transporter [Trebonia sp.]|nr:MFS transporter [Trebonia sp.]
MHRVTGASGAGQTGLGTLVELTAAASVADAFVAVSLAGTIFFSTNIDQARGQVALFLLVTMAPFALFTPVIGPALDRLQQGRKYLLAGTLVARGLLCWGMSAAIKDPVTLLPAAFGILVLQKCYAVVRASVAPRLLPAQLSLVKANARSALITLVASSVAAPAAAGIAWTAGAAWLLRAGTIVYLLTSVLALRLPGNVDVPVLSPDETPTEVIWIPPPGPDGQHGGPGSPSAPAGPPYPPRGPSGTLAIEQGQAPGAGGPGAAPGRRRRLRAPRTLGGLGPVVAEAMRGNAVLRALSGFMIFFLAFLLRSLHFGGVSPNIALGAMVVAAAAGGLAAMGIGAAIGSRAPQAMMYTMLVVATVVTAGCAWFFGLAAALIVAFVAALSTGLAKLAQDAIVQGEISEDVRSSAFSVSETLHQLSWVVGGLLGLLVSMLNNGRAGLAIVAALLAAGVAYLLVRRRRGPATTAADAGEAPPA